MTVICSFNRNGERVIFSDGRMTNTRDCKIAIENSKKRCLYDTITSLVPNISNKDLAEEIVASVSKRHIDVGGKLQYVAIKEEEK